ncbi:hypothetical protein M1545_02350, partial [Patescibacteria group bacterium]|nr:hypothetical protein [Patescibacteria group bacterium]
MKGNPKATFLTIFSLLAIFLLLLPFLTTFNELLTSIFLKMGWYRLIESFILPLETRMIVVFLGAMGQQASASATSISILKNGVWEKIIISWNCLGWQSMLVLLLTLATGLQGAYTKVSKIECAMIGILGTILVNILRISLVAILIVYVRGVPATVIHDYSSVIILILWLFFFWEF